MSRSAHPSRSATRWSCRAVMAGAALAVTLLPGCAPNPCVDYCQVLDHYVHRCGTSWEAAYGDEGWHSIDECYDDAWDASDSEQASCSTDAVHVANEDCY